MNQQNQFKNQYLNKRFKNKHRKSSWRHYNAKKYAKKSLSKEKHKIRQQYFNMKYEDAVSEYQQDLENKFYFVDKNSNYTVSNGNVIKHTSTQRTERSAKFNKSAAKLETFVNELFTSTNGEMDEYFAVLQLQNYNKHCKSLFLCYKNCFLYDMKLEALQKLRQIFGSRYPQQNHWHFYNNTFLSEYMYHCMARVYYNKSKNSALHIPNHFDTIILPCIEIKTAHCLMILEDILALGSLKKKKTINILYESISYYDLCLLIMEYMGSFPQIPPQPTKYGYNSEFDTFALVILPPPTLYISQTQLLYPYGAYMDEEDTISIQFDNVESNDVYDVMHMYIIDIEDVKNHLDAELKEYRLLELYHLYLPYGIWSQSEHFVLVAKIQPKCTCDEPLFIYFESEPERSVVILSAFWMDLWSKIPSDAIKVDCYADTRLPKHGQTVYNTQETQLVGITYQYDY